MRAAMVSINTMTFQMGQLAKSAEAKSSKEEEEKGSDKTQSRAAGTIDGKFN